MRSDLQLVRSNREGFGAVEGEDGACKERMERVRRGWSVYSIACPLLYPGGSLISGDRRTR